MAINRRSRLLLLACVLPLWGGCAREAALGRPWVHDLDIKGNRRFSDRTIAKGLATRQTGWWPFAAKRYYDPATLRTDLQRIVGFYHEHGYFDAAVVKDEVRERGKKSVDITITVAEGEPTRVTEVDLRGVAELPARLRARLARKVPIAKGQVFDYQRFLQAKADLRAYLKERGYAYAKVAGTVLVNRETRSAVVRLEVRPGPVVRFGRITVEGNDGLPAHAVRQRVVFEPGDRYSPKAIDRSETLIYDLGVFSSVVLKLPDEPTPTADVTAHVVPAVKLHELKLGGGLGIEAKRQEARLRIEWVWHNFLGGMRTLRLRTRPGYAVIPSITNVQRQGVAARNDVQLTQPDIFKTGITAQGLLGYDLQIEEGYQYHGPRAQLGLARPFWRDRLLLAASWNLQYLTFFNIDEAVFNPATTPLGFGFVNPYRLAYLEEAVVLDLRDNRVTPHRGAYLLAKLEQGFGAIGGDFNYVKLAPDLRGYVPLGGRVTLALRAFFGWLRPQVRATDSPVTRRFYLGGPSDHRGFSYGRLSPQVYDPEEDRLVPVGGDGAVLFSGEVRINLLKLRGYWLSFVPFIDAGDVTPEVSQLDLAALNIAVGPELVYLTPIGPVRAGLGIRLNRLGPIGPNGLANPDPGDRFAFHIAIGEAF